MKICNSTWSFHRLFGEGKVNAFTFPAECRKLGISALEYVEDHVQGTDREHLEKLKGIVQDEGCVIAAVAVNNDFTFVDVEESGRQIEHVRQWMQIAHFLGAKAVRVNTGGHEVGDQDAAIIRVVQAFKDLLPTAEQTGVKMALENHWGLSSLPQNVERIVKGVGSEFFGTCPDFGNFPAEVDRYEALAILCKYAKHVHAKSYEFGPDGEETKFSYKRVLGILKDSGYDGYLSIEFEGPGEQIDGARKTEELIKRYM